MVRRTIAQLTGSDPEYSKQFVNDTPRSETPAPQAPKVEKAKRVRKPDHAAEPTKLKKAAPSTDINRRKQVNFSLVPLVRHLADLDHLSSLGISGPDVIKIAGRRVIADFEPKAAYIGQAEEDRLSAQHAYKTTKKVDADMMDRMRAETDPLNLRADGSLLRGQIEPLFWQELDAVIVELKGRFQKDRE